MIEWEPYDTGEETGIEELLVREGYSGPRVFWCKEVQSQQDAGVEWGICIELADELFGKLI